MYENVFEEVKEIINNYLCKSPGELLIQNSTKLKDLKLDSLDLLELIILIEDRFDISIENAHNIITYGNLIEVVCNNLELRSTQHVQ